MALDRGTISILVAGNVIALAVLYQRLLALGYAPPLHEAYTYVVHDWLQVMATPRSDCGHHNLTTFMVASSRVVLPSGVKPATLTIRHGDIVEISDGLPTGKKVPYPLVDYGHAVIMPGVVDVHAHLNEPGREDWEGLETGTSAAAAGGVTTVIDMPLNSHPCTTTPERVKEKLELAKVKGKVNVGVWGGLVPENAGNHTLLWEMLKAGALGFKSFMAPSGIDDFPHVSREDLALALPFLSEKGIPLLVHAEEVADVEEPPGSPNSYAKYEASRPPSFEIKAIHTLLELLLLENQRQRIGEGFVLHIAHLSDAVGSATSLRVAQRQLPISVETCPHYLSFQAENIPDGGTEFKCAPPIRGASNREALLKLVENDVIKIVSSDHSPAPPGMKQRDSGDFLKAWGGISGIQYLLPATWTAIKELPGNALVRLSHMLSVRPAALAGLTHKGAIQRRHDADLVVFDPEAWADTSGAANLHRHKLSPYTDMKLKGKVLATYVRGHLVYTADKGVTEQACGELAKRRWINRILKKKRSRKPPR